MEFAALEPMSTGDVIDRAVRLYRRNFFALVAIVAVPSLIRYVANLLVTYGYADLFLNMGEGPGMTAFLMLATGLFLYIASFFLFLVAVSSVSRLVGDYIMLDEPISFRRSIKAVRRRLGDIALMALLALVVGVGLYIVFAVVLFGLLFVSVIILAATGGLASTAGAPEWAIGLAVGLVVLVVAAAFLILLLVVLSRVVFLPQVVMIEGQSAGSALGRAIRLGGGNWYKVGSILLFTYFVTASIIAAVTLPFLLIVYLNGSLTAEFFTQPTWTVLYSAFSQLTDLLVVPIWVTAFTLLYFDSRVRKEGYDLELLTHGMQTTSDDIQWHAGMAPSAFGYEVPIRKDGRVFVQTSPLGLAGYAPPTRATVSAPGERTDGASPPQQPSSVPSGRCPACTAILEPGARFCIICGAEAVLAPADGT